MRLLGLAVIPALSTRNEIPPQGAFALQAPVCDLPCNLGRRRLAMLPLRESNLWRFAFLFDVRTFAAELELDSNFIETTRRLRKELDRELRWPEPVTLEEMNVQRSKPNSHRSTDGYTFRED